MTVIINQNWLQENVNEKADNSAFDHLVDFTGKATGAYRTLQISQKTVGLGSEVAKELGYGISPALNEFGHKLGIGASALDLPRLPSATSEAIKSLSALRKEDDVSFFRKAIKAVRDTMDAIGAYSYASIFITANPALKPVAQAAVLTADFADLQMSTSDYSKASELEAIATGDAKVALNHSKKYYFLRILKAVASIATAILGFTVLVSLMPVIALMIVFMSSTVFAIMRDLHKESGRFNVIKFDSEVTV